MPRQPDVLPLQQHGQCGTPGCTLPDFHTGPCMTQKVCGPRDKRPSAKLRAEVDEDEPASKRAKPAAKQTAKPAAKPTKTASTAKEATGGSSKKAFLQWTLEQIGDETGSGLDAEMKEVLRSEGPSSPALVKLLAA